MFDFLDHLLLYAFGLAVLSAGGFILVHWLWPKESPPGIQRLAELFMAILTASSKVILGPFELCKRIRISIGGERDLPTPPSNAESDTSLGQPEGGRPLTKLLAAPEKPS
jgi:hypothetical protein